MLELVMVIVVLGILAALALPRMDRDLRQEAADNVLSAIRYTQHLAMVDDKTNPFDPKWQQTLWLIRFINPGSEWCYIVASNMDHQTNIDQNESAIDPANGKYMHTGDAAIDSDESPNIFLTHKYGIDSIIFNNCKGVADTSAKHIAFDNLGRPYRGIIDTSATITTANEYKRYVSNNDCQITFNSPSFDSNFTIEIKRETGYAFIVGQPDS